VKLEQYERVTTLERGYELAQDEHNQILGGGGWLKLTQASKGVGIDLELLGLNRLWEDEESIHIGAMSTLREIELHPLLTEYASGSVAKSASIIMGVNLRNIITIGGTVCGKYGFSDMLTVLLALDAELVFYPEKKMKLDEFLQQKGKVQDILIEVILPKLVQKGYFDAYKKTSLDFSLVNVAVVQQGDIRISIGARPGVAKVYTLVKDSPELNELIAELSGLTTKENKGNNKGYSAPITQLVERCVSEFTFGSNPRASREYRIELAKNFVQHGLREVLL